MDTWEKTFLVLMTIAMFVVGTLGGRFGRSGSWRAGIALGTTAAVATAVVAWRQFKE